MGRPCIDLCPCTLNTHVDQLRRNADRGAFSRYNTNNRKPYHGINFVVCHDGFTLYDLVAYNDKHNDANGEQGRDGSNDNFSWNCGAEGETGDEGINVRPCSLAIHVTYDFTHPPCEGRPHIILSSFLLPHIHSLMPGTCHMQFMRQKQMKNMMVALLVSNGIPMVLMGDEVMSTRHGNNNYYGHDNEMTAFDWTKYDQLKDSFFRFYR